MSEANTKQWIVLLQKSPRGPLSTAEVDALLDEGLLRRNDLAFPVAEDGATKLSDWKFLWQFEEFNRRAPELPNQRPPDPTPEESESALTPDRRSRRAPTEAERVAAIASLPSELIDLDPADLALHSPMHSGGLSRGADHAPPPMQPVRMTGRRSGRPIFYGSATLGLALVGYLTYLISSAPTPNQAAANDLKSARAPAGTRTVRRRPPGDPMNAVETRPSRAVAGRMPQAREAVPFTAPQALGGPRLFRTHSPPPIRTPRPPVGSGSQFDGDDDPDGEFLAPALRKGAPVLDTPERRERSVRPIPPIDTNETSEPERAPEEDSSSYDE